MKEVENTKIKMENSNSKYFKINIFLVIGSVVLGVILTTAASVFELQIKRVLNIEPKIVWQESSVFSEKQNFYKVNLYNKSDSSGDVSVTVGELFKEEDFEISGIQTKPVIENDQSNTYLKIDTVYPNEEIEILLTTSKSVVFPEINVSSKIFKTKNKYPFPYDEKYRNNFGIVILVFVFLYIIVMSNWLTYAIMLNRYHKDKS